MEPMAGATPDLGAELASLRLRREPGAGAPGGKPRVTAESALKRLGAALHDATYLPQTTQRLFPAVDLGTPQRQATRDWVLFRRRARLSCGSLAIHNAASGGMLTIYSSLPFQGSQRPQTVDIEKGIKLALKEAGNKAGAFTIKYISNDDSSAQAGTWSAENVSANAHAASQDESTAVYIQGWPPSLAPTTTPARSRRPTGDWRRCRRGDMLTTLQILRVNGSSGSRDRKPYQWLVDHRAAAGPSARVALTAIGNAGALREAEIAALPPDDEHQVRAFTGLARWDDPSGGLPPWTYKRTTPVPTSSR